MRAYIIGSSLCLILAAAAPGGDGPKEKPFKEMSTEDLGGLPGIWEAAIHTPNGWKGTLRATITLKRNNPEVSVFHNFMALRYDLKNSEKKPEAVASGNFSVALIPCQKDKQRYVQLLRDFQVQQKEFLLDVLEFRGDDKKAAKEFAELQPSKRDTAAIWIAANSWTLEVAPIVLEFLPKKGAPGPEIDWEPRIVWKKVK